MNIISFFASLFVLYASGVQYFNKNGKKIASSRELPAGRFGKSMVMVLFYNEVAEHIFLSDTFAIALALLLNPQLPVRYRHK